MHRNIHTNEPFYSYCRHNVRRILRICNNASGLFQSNSRQANFSHGAVSSSLTEEKMERNAHLRVIQHGNSVHNGNTFGGLLVKKQWEYVCQT